MLLTLDTDRYKLSVITRSVLITSDVYHLVFHALNRSQAESLVDILKKGYSTPLHWEPLDRFGTKIFNTRDIHINGIDDRVEGWLWEVSCNLQTIEKQTTIKVWPED